MIQTWKQYEGQAVDGIPLVRLLGGSETSAVYLGELAGAQCAIKLVRVQEEAAQIPLARWQQASKLSHPNLARIRQWGRARLNGESLVYLAMEFGEEVLEAVDRPLTPKEARELLTPAVNALLYLHGQKMAHGRIRPSNILSVNEVLKISGDAPLRIGERHAIPSSYDAPELANTGVSPAADVWSLGMTLVQALTKQLPVGESDPPRLPDSLKPDTFREVVSGCLRRDPAQRWSMADIALWLERGTVPAPKRPPRRWILPAAAAAAVVVAAAVALPHFRNSAPASSAVAPAVTQAANPQPDPAPDAAPAPDTPSAAAAPNHSSNATPTPSKNEAKSKTKPATVAEATPPSAPINAPPAPEKPPVTAKQSAPAAASSSQSASSTPPSTSPSAALPSAPAPSSPSPEDVIPADVVASVRPEPIAKARSSIHGKIPIFVRVEADASGAVTEAKIESGGSSKYFAELSVKAARQWKFAPGDAAQVWMVRFEYTKNNDHPVIIQASRVK